MSKVLVCGDFIVDAFQICDATRLCPEAPAPVLVPRKPSRYDTNGGCALVRDQLVALLGRDSVEMVSGSISRKERIFAGSHLICRIDYDGTVKTPDYLRDRTLELLTDTNPPDLLIISDYGKGAITQEAAKRIMDMAASREVPVLVDAKHTFSFYPGAFCYFPNERESFSSIYLAKNSHVIQKLGERGCTVDGEIVPPAKVKVIRDTTGAGDCFLAAFAACLTHTTQDWNDPNILSYCARYANKVAGKSVEFFGTHVVSKSEIEEETN